MIDHAHRAACWGERADGMLGDGGTKFEPEPVRVPALHDVLHLGAIPRLAGATDLSVQENFGCAALASGQVWCWGENHLGELGRGRKGNAEAAGPVPGIALAVEVHTGDIRSCARLRDGSIRCWGDLFADQKLTPVPMPGFPPAVSVAVGLQHLCVASNDGRVFCQGSERASGTTTGEFHGPIEIAGPKDVVRVVAAGDYACALERQGRVLCWGENAAGQLGDGTFVGRETAAPALGFDSAREVSLEPDRACALLGSVYCWGGNEFDALGTGHGKSATEPVPISLTR